MYVNGESNQMCLPVPMCEHVYLRDCKLICNTPVQTTASTLTLKLQYIQDIWNPWGDLEFSSLVIFIECLDAQSRLVKCFLISHSFYC